MGQNVNNPKNLPSIRSLTIRNAKDCTVEEYCLESKVLSPSRSLFCEKDFLCDEEEEGEKEVVEEEKTSSTSVVVSKEVEVDVEECREVVDLCIAMT